MNRIFLRISLGMVVVLVASFFTVRWGAQHGAERYVKAGKLSDLMASVDFARRRLEQVPHKRWPEVVRSLREEIATPVKLLPTSSSEISPQALDQLRKDRLHITFSHGQGRRIFLPLQGGQQVLVMGPIEPFFHGHFYPTWLVLSAILGIITITGFMLAAPIVRRLRRLEQTAIRISEGQLQARTEDSSNDAIGSLARRFNFMAERVQELLESQRQLIQAVAHELRTPLARVRFSLEMLTSSGTDEEQAQRLISIDEDLAELDELVEELLLYIRSGEKALRLDKQPVDALQEISRIVELLRDQRAGIMIQLEAPDLPDAVILADPKAFRRVIQNLLANGLKVAQQQITIRLSHTDKVLSIAICDDGPGIPQEDRQRIFEPFTRLDQSRSRDSGGSGLGLAIVQRIIEAHQGSITIDRTAEGGAQFITTWHRAVQPPYHRE